MAERDTSTPTPAEDAVEIAQGDEAEGLTQRRRRRFIKWGVISLAVVVVILLVLPVVSMLQPGYYRRYPALRDRMDHWAVSTHSRISCAECHVNPGAGAFLTFAAKSIPAFYSQLVKGPSTTNLLRAPTRAACQKCHTTYRQVSPAGDLLIPHRAHVVVLDMQCVTCHKNLVHSPNRRGFNRPEMEGCVGQCHNGDTASDQCTDCHTRKQTPDTHERADWLAIHGTMADTIDCSECHDWTPEYCAACHEKRPASHAGNWKKDHAPVAKKRGDGCLVCHGGEKFCKECH
ncbi:MAG: hypothetical protein OEV43_10220 [Coriobacteriia bacterium]|nr:hypothetical protein [Coriobacteriia bacterium]